MQRYWVICDVHGTSAVNDYHLKCVRTLFHMANATLNFGDPVHAVFDLGDQHFRKDSNYFGNISQVSHAYSTLDHRIGLYLENGNHDGKNDVRSQEILRDIWRVKAGREHLVGHQVIDVGPVQFMFFQPDVYACNKKSIPGNSLWLNQSDLDFYNGHDFSKPTVVLSHVCLGNVVDIITQIKCYKHRNDPDFEEWRGTKFNPYNSCYVNASELKVKPALAISGHLHHVFKEGVFVSQPAFLGGKGCASGDPVFAEIRVGNDSLSYQFMRMNMNDVGQVIEIAPANDILPEIGSRIEIPFRSFQ